MAVIARFYEPKTEPDELGSQERTRLMYRGYVLGHLSQVRVAPEVRHDKEYQGATMRLRYEAAQVGPPFQVQSGWTVRVANTEYEVLSNHAKPGSRNQVAELREPSSANL